jgi:hypothetical protein
MADSRLPQSTGIDSQAPERENPKSEGNDAEDGIASAEMIGHRSSSL